MLFDSLRSKRFRKVFRTLFFSRAKIGASAKKCVNFFAPAPIFPRPKSEKCIERAESLTETLATQASCLMPNRTRSSFFRDVATLS